MTTFTVTTTEDIVDADDGLLSLREAVAAANASAAEDTIIFSADLINEDTQTVTVDEGALLIEAAGGALTISGDVDDDGLADILLSAGSHHHFTVASGADLTLIGMDLFGGQLVQNGGGSANGGDGGRGEDLGIAAGVADFFPVSVLANRIEIENRSGTDGDDGATGGAGGDGANGADSLDQGASIDNAGTLSLERVGFGSNSGFGPNGGNAGRGGNGGFGEQGGEGFPGISVTRADGVILNNDRLGNSVVEGGDGGDGGRGGDGGDGGAGGDVAGAILNREGGSVELTDVSFGGGLLSGIVFGGSFAIGGQGGRPGSGGTGGGGGAGGDGGLGGVIFDIITNEDGEQIDAFGTAGDGGNGGDGGNSGDGGDGGAFGDAGSAAGAILNKGVVTGKAAFSGNSGTAGTPRPSDPGDLNFGSGFTNIGASAGDPEGPGGASTADSRTGLSVNIIGAPGAAGAPGQSGQRGENFRQAAPARRRMMF